MPLFLVSFALYPERKKFNYETSIVELPRAPQGLSTIVTLRAMLAAEFGCDDAILLGWDPLPDADQHPSNDPERFCYFISYVGEVRGELGNGCTAIARKFPITSISDLRGIEEATRLENSLRRVRLLSCKPLEGTA